MAGAYWKGTDSPAPIVVIASTAKDLLLHLLLRFLEGISSNLCFTAERPQLAANSAHKRPKTPANCALETQK